MHRHGAQGKTLGRGRDQRRALIRNLATSLVEHGRIETTLPKAKALVPYTERLITKAGQGTLHARRQVISGLSTEDAARKLIEEIFPKLTRTSGRLRIVRTNLRLGDGAQLARVEFVDDLTVPSKPVVKPTRKVVKTAKPAAKTAVKKPAAKKPVAKKTGSKA